MSSTALLPGLLICLTAQILGILSSPASGNLLQQHISAGLAAGDETIRIPPGRYEVAPENGMHLVLEGIRDVTIDARGVEMVCKETTLAVQIKDCTNLRIEGLTIDYDPLPFTQGRIVEISADRKSHIIEIMDGFPPAEDAYVFKHSIYTPAGELRFGSYYQYELEVLSEGRLKVHGLRQDKDGGEQLGDIVVVSTRHLTGPYRPHAVVVENSNGTVIDGVHIYSSPCFGFFELGSSGSVYRNCVVDRREGRVHSLNADAFHSKHAEVGPQILNCKAMWQGDDCVNICGDYYLVTGVEKEWVRLLTPRKVHVQEGDSLQLVSAEGERLGDAVAVKVRRIGQKTASDVERLGSLNLHRKVIEALTHVYTIRLDRAAAGLGYGALVASNDRMGRGFSVKNCLFGNNRSRGILIKATDGEISGNDLINTRMQAIKIAPEFHWLESGFSRDVKVVGNRIVNPGMEAISILGMGAFTGHENLQVLDNTIRTGKSPAVRINSVRNGRVAGNDILDMDGLPLPDPIKVAHSEGIELASAGPRKNTGRPNILFCIMDDASYPHMGAYGTDWVTTPAFDRIATEGILFNNAYTPNAKCAPSRATVLTGRNSWQLGQIGNHLAVWPERGNLTVFEALSNSGYHTGWTGKGWAPGVIENGADRLLTGKEFNVARTTPPTADISNKDYPANFQQFLDDNPDGKPWAFWFGPHEPHRAYTYGSGAEIGGKQLSDIDKVPAFWPDNTIVRHDMLDYALEIEYADRQLGEMLRILEERGQLENTLIVVTADNGMPFPRSKGLEYEYSNHVPLAIMWQAGIRNPGRSESGFVSFVDLAPTFLAVAGVDWASSGMEPTPGKDLVEVFADSYRKHDRSYVLLGQERHDYGRPGNQGYPIRSIIRDGYLYIHNFKPDLWPAGNPETGYLNTDGSPTKTLILRMRREDGDARYWQLNFGRNPPEQLYRIADDPECLLNLAGLPDYALIKESLKSRLFADLARQGDPRVVGPDGDVFDRYPWSEGDKARDYYERFMAGQIKHYQTGWVEPTDYE